MIAVKPRRLHKRRIRTGIRIGDIAIGLINRWGFERVIYEVRKKRKLSLGDSTHRQESIQ